MNYKTTDLYLAAVLRTMGFEIIDQIKEKKVVTFVFGNIKKEEAEDIKNDFLNNNIEVPAKSFVIAIKELKSRIYDFD